MTTTLTLAGELDLATVPELREQMIAATEAGARSLVLDMREVSFMDSTALAAIINAKKRMGEGGQVTLVLPRDSYGRLIFEATGLDGVLDVVETI
jgi:anti-sigma B factor antagonist